MKSILDLKANLEPITTGPFTEMQYSDGYTVECVLPNGIKIRATGISEYRTRTRLYTEINKRGFVPSKYFTSYTRLDEKRPRGATIQEIDNV